jgi:hypothetical protein
VGTDPEEQATASAAEPAAQAGSHVEGVRQLLEQSRQEAQQAAARIRETRRRLQWTAERTQQVAAAAAATKRATAATVDRFVKVKRGEVEAHARAVALHEQAAALQARLGHPERAAQARAHADHAREMSQQAKAELDQYLARITAARDRTGRKPRRPA